MSDTPALPDDFVSVAADIDRLGWDCMLEGRIPHSLVGLQQGYLIRNKSFWKIRTWSSHLIQHLLNITHRQWLYRNAKIHIRKLDGMTASEHHTVIELVKDMLLVDPTDLLPRHRILLERDYVALGEGSSVDRKLWLEQMNSALLAARTSNSTSTTESRPQSSHAHSALDKYKTYREKAGILRTKRSNMAKRVRLT